MRVALIQMTSVPDLDVNIKSILNGIRKAKEHKADIVLFPENCAFMGRGSETLAAATEESKHPALLAAREAALKYSIYGVIPISQYKKSFELTERVLNNGKSR